MTSGVPGAVRPATLNTLRVGYTNTPAPVTAAPSVQTHSPPTGPLCRKWRCDSGGEANVNVPGRSGMERGGGGGEGGGGEGAHEIDQIPNIIPDNVVVFRLWQI